MTKEIDVTFVGKVNVIGCVTIPQDIREKYGIKRGTVVKVKLLEMME